MEMSVALGMQFARAARNGLSGIDLAADGAHWMNLVDEICDEFLSGRSAISGSPRGLLSNPPILGILGIPPAVFLEASHHGWFCRGLAKMRRALAGDVGFSDPEADLAGRNKGDCRLWLTGNLQSVVSVRIGSHVECLHPGQLTPHFSCHLGGHGCVHT